MSIATTKKKKILQNVIARKRLNKANFFNANIKIKNIDYICCIPINGYPSSLLQNIRTLLAFHEYNVTQFTTKSFLAFLRINSIKIKKEDLSLFYIGQMLVLTINLNIKSSFSVKNQYKIHKNSLTLLQYVLKDIPFATLMYIANNNESKHIVVQNISSNFIETIPAYFNNSIYFKQLNTNILEFLRILLMQIIYLLSLISVFTFTSNSILINKK